MKDEVKNLLKEGRIVDANKALGYAYSVSGEVKVGLKNGRKIDFPTLNIENGDNLLPNGAYMTKTVIDGTSFKSMTNIGTHPTISELKVPIIETHVIDFSKDIYGSNVKVEFYKFLRPEKKFGSLDELKTQLKNDLDTCRKEEY